MLHLWESSPLHDAEELFLVDFTVTIAISFINHVLTKLLSHTLQVLERNLLGLVIIEKTEHLDNFLTRIAVAHASSHHVEELVEIDGAGAILVEEVECLTDLLDLVVCETFGLGWGTA